MNKQRYEEILEKWKQHCIQRNINPYVADVNTTLEFVHGRYKSGCLYSLPHEVNFLVL